MWRGGGRRSDDDGGENLSYREDRGGGGAEVKQIGLKGKRSGREEEEEEKSNIYVAACAALIKKESVFDNQQEGTNTRDVFHSVSTDAAPSSSPALHHLHTSARKQKQMLLRLPLLPH